MNKILAAWAWNGPVSEPIAYGEGHINQTYALTEQATQKRYILQKINTDTFKDPDGLMENICGVTDFLREKAKQRGADPERATLHVALTKAGKPYYKAADGGCWRVYDFVENTVCLQQVQSSEDFYQSAVAFGNFQHQLADYPANTLHETIPHFHDTPKRFADFQRAVAEDRMGRAAQVQREIEFVRAREEDYHVMVDLLTAGKLPLRVTHNDTKLNNILFDKTTGEGLCVIDLDTVMPGLAANDFGDSIRFGANHCAEDESDLSKVNFSMELFEIYTKGAGVIKRRSVHPAGKADPAVGCQTDDDGMWYALPRRLSGGRPLLSHQLRDSKPQPRPNPVQTDRRHGEKLGCYAENH